jgi:hypothetical protein
MREIPLTRGMVAIVDDEDYEALAVYKWMATEKRNGKFYAVRSVGTRASRKTVAMHRVIMNAGPDDFVDHKDDNTLDNRKGISLRKCTRAQNQRNRHARNGKSGYKGVYFLARKRSKPWRAEISVDNKSVHLGYFDTDIEAAKACDAEAIARFGEFANLNFPEIVNAADQSSAAQ